MKRLYEFYILLTGAFVLAPTNFGTAKKKTVNNWKSVVNLILYVERLLNTYLLMRQ